MIIRTWQDEKHRKLTSTNLNLIFYCILFITEKLNIIKDLNPEKICWHFYHDFVCLRIIQCLIIWDLFNIGRLTDFVFICLWKWSSLSCDYGIFYHLNFEKSSTYFEGKIYKRLTEYQCWMSIFKLKTIFMLLPQQPQNLMYNVWIVKMTQK